MLTRAGIFIVIAPIIGPANQGTIVVTSAWSAIVALVVAYGFQLKVLREIPGQPERARSIVKSDLSAMVALTGPGTLLAILVGSFVIPEEDWLIFAVVFAATLNTVVIDYSSCALRGMDSYLVEFRVSLLSAIAQFTLVICVGLMFREVLPIVIALLISRSLTCIVALTAVFRDPMVISASHGEVERVDRTIRRSWPFFTDASLSVTLSQIDVILLNFVADRYAIGLYAAGARLVQLLLAIPWMVTNVAVPAIVGAQGSAARAHEKRNLALAMTATGGFGALFLLFGGPFFTHYFLGEAFVELNALWPIFSVFLLARFFEQHQGILMLVQGRMIERVYAQMAGVLAITAGAFLLVPTLSTTGMILTLGTTAVGIGFFYSITLWRERETSISAALVLSALIVGILIFLAAVG